MNPATPDWRTALLAVFDEELSASSDLLAVLRTEREALKQRDLEALSRNGDAKVKLLVALEELETERRQVLTLTGLPTDGDALIERLGRQDPLALRWQRILGLIGECRHMNEANGRLVVLQRARVEQALGVLRGEPDAPVYGPDGNRQGSHRPNALASA